MAELEIKPGPMMLLRLAGVVCLAAGLAFALVWLLTQGGSEIFESWATISTYLPDATGVANGTPVRLSGIQIGEVTAVNLSNRLDPQHAVKIDMSVRKRYLKNIPLDSKTAVNAETLIGDKFIDITEGKSEASLPENGVLESEPVKQAADRADLMRALADDLRQVDSLLATLSDPNTRLGHFIVGEAEYDQALERLNEFDRMARGFVAPDSPLAQALFTTRLYEAIRADASRIDGALDAIQRGEGAAGRLFFDDRQYEELTSSVRGIRNALVKLDSGQGKAGALLAGDAAYRKLADALRQADDSLASLESGRGRVGNLMGSAQVYESLNGALRRLADVLRDFHEHPQKYMRYRVFGKKKTK